jgi:phospholipase/lecithinase/hemolysin
VESVPVEVNFAFGGAQTGSGNTAAVLAPGLGHAVGWAGLELLGLEQQLHLLQATVLDVDPEGDLFWIFAGTNDYLAGQRDPAVAPARLREAMNTLYDEQGARRFVVPNLFALGNVPLFQGFPRVVRRGLNARIREHNRVLADELASFEAEHPDAWVASVDSHAVFESLVSNPFFTNLTDSCVDSALAEGRDCTGWVYLDKIHSTSAAMASLAEAAAAAITECMDVSRIRRIITLGDSLSDTGAFQDTGLRATGVAFLPAPTYFADRFADGPNLLDQVEELLELPVRTSFFAQPYQATLSTTPAEPWAPFLTGQLELVGSVFVPGSIDARGQGFIVLGFGRQYCEYVAPRWRPHHYGFVGCTDGTEAGDRIDTNYITIFARRTSRERIKVTLLYY